MTERRATREMTDTTNVIPLPAARANESTVAELAATVAALAADVRELRAAVAAVMPPPRFELPASWISVKEAVHVSGLSSATIYRRIATGEILGVKHGIMAVDPSTLPAVRK